MPHTFCLYKLTSVSKDQNCIPPVYILQETKLACMSITEWLAIFVLILHLDHSFDMASISSALIFNL